MLLAIVAWLTRHAVDLAVYGGFAVAAWGMLHESLAPEGASR